MTPILLQSYELRDNIVLIQQLFHQFVYKVYLFIVLIMESTLASSHNFYSYSFKSDIYH
jgi:hypothetical protein